ncbi:MAG TPA: hypothetical protein VGO63_01690 [Candidatus Paceibacterota bacterium]|jgi:hypothetical protein|nr:hypothetical protein [Candidatus Paceibacterota bacterium]
MNINAKRVLKIGSISAFFLIIIVFAFFRSYDLVFGVKIKNVRVNEAALQSGATIPESVMQVSGVAKNAIHLSMNGREISVDQSGNFNETIALLPGYNIMNITARDKFGYIDEKNYQLIHEVAAP